MKIDGNNDLMRMIIKPVQKDAKKGSTAFGEVLDDALKNPDACQTQNTISNIGLGGAVKPIGMDRLSFDRPIVDQTEDLIELLADYQGKLGNPSVPLREIEPVMQQMDSLGRKLVPNADSLPGNHPLKEILAQTLITVSLELQRFNSGQYNP
jgi:hypothetical protein